MNHKLGVCVPYRNRELHLNEFIPKVGKFLKDSNIEFNSKLGKKNSINASGIYSIDSKNYQKYTIENENLNKISSTTLNFEFSQKLNIDFINYEKNLDKKANIYLKLYKAGNSINLQKLKYEENQNLILIESLKLNKKSIKSLKKIKVKTFKNEDLNNDFSLNFGKKIRVSGNKFDANNLNKFLNDKSKNNALNKVSKEVEIDLKNIETPLSKN